MVARQKTLFTQSLIFVQVVFLISACGQGPDQNVAENQNSQLRNYTDPLVTHFFRVKCANSQATYTLETNDKYVSVPASVSPQNYPAQEFTLRKDLADSTSKTQALAVNLRCGVDYLDLWIKQFLNSVQCYRKQPISDKKTLDALSIHKSQSGQDFVMSSWSYGVLDDVTSTPVQVTLPEASDEQLQCSIEKN